jgi:HAD superfamily hydrolase (TIGR01458 family)
LWAEPSTAGEQEQGQGLRWSESRTDVTIMRKIEGLLVDLDGTVYQGSELLPGAAVAVDGLRARACPFLFTTNTSRKARSDVAASLCEMGLPVVETEIFTAPVAAARWLRQEGLTRVQLLVPAATRADFADFDISDAEPDAVLVGDLGREFTFERLNAAFRSLRGGARLVAIHRNRFWLPEGEPTLDAGPFVAALEYATGQTATLVGKPSPAFFETASALLGVAPSGLAVVGDDIESDIKGGRAAGLISVQVRTGKFDEALLERAGPDERPHSVLSSFADVVGLLS